LVVATAAPRETVAVASRANSRVKGRMLLLLANYMAWKMESFTYCTSKLRTWFLFYIAGPKEINQVRIH
jgi:hypothetical protein